MKINKDKNKSGFRFATVKDVADKKRDARILTESFCGDISAVIQMVPSKMENLNSRRQLVAYHEAGHACVGTILGCKDVKVEINSDNILPADGQTIEKDDGIYTLDDIEQQIMVLIAGQLSCWHFLHVRDIGSTADMQAIYRLVEHALNSGVFGFGYVDYFNEHSTAWLVARDKIIKKYLFNLSQRVIEILFDAEKYIDEVAKRLMSDGKLSNPELMRLKKEYYRKVKDQIP